MHMERKSRFNIQTGGTRYKSKSPPPKTRTKPKGPSYESAYDNNLPTYEFFMKASPMETNILFDREIKSLREEITRLKSENCEIKSMLEEIIEMIKYAPGGPVFIKAKNDFDSIKN